VQHAQRGAAAARAPISAADQRERIAREIQKFEETYGGKATIVRGADAAAAAAGEAAAQNAASAARDALASARSVSESADSDDEAQPQA
jgi:hypothetical protein